jgi:hypothetical protein
MKVSEKLNHYVESLLLISPIHVIIWTVIDTVPFKIINHDDKLPSSSFK